VVVAMMLFGKPLQGGTTGEVAAAAPSAAKSAAPSGAKAADATPAALEKTVVQIESVPSGAAVTVDGQAASQATPVPVTFSSPGPHAVRLSKRGFVNQDVNLTAADVRKGSVSYTLVP